MDECCSIEFVLAVMRAHSDNADLSERACVALRSVCCNNGSFEMFDLFLAMTKLLMYLIHEASMYRRERGVGCDGWRSGCSDGDHENACQQHH